MDIKLKSMLIVGIYGGTGSGKTTIVNQILSHFPATDIQVISQDSYYKDTSNLTFEERCLLNFDHPEAIDFELLYDHLVLLKERQAIDQPVYCFKTHNRTAETIKTYPKKILILEGILIMNYPKLRRLLDLRIFIEANSEMRMERRVRRDIAERGRTPKEVMDRYLNTLKPMHDQFIEPMKIHADLVINNHQNEDINITGVIDRIKSLIG
jgi:uridine kinase